MSFPCLSCSKEFGNGAALNFHAKKAHMVPSLDSNKTVAEEDKTVRRSKRQRGPSIVKFGKFPGIPDCTKGPFKVSKISLKIVEENEARLEKSKPPARTRYSTSSSEQEITGLVKSKTKKMDAVKRKAGSDVSDGSEDKTFPPEVSSTTPEPEMPVLSPQVTSPVSPTLGRPGPKRSKQGKHWKYDQNEDDSSLDANKIRGKAPTTSAKISRFSDDDAMPSMTNVSRPESRTSQSNASTDTKVLGTVTDEPCRKERFNSGSRGGVSGRSTTSSVVSGDTGGSSISPKVNATSEQSPPGNKQTNRGRSKAAQPSVSGRVQVCPVCGKNDFRNVGHFTNHLEIHEGRRPFLCPHPECGLGYDTEMKVMEHVTIRHCQEAMFTCPRCTVQYKTKRGLENHKCC